jgi:hypothetical protein
MLFDEGLNESYAAEFGTTALYSNVLSFNFRYEK